MSGDRHAVRDLVVRADGLFAGDETRPQMQPPSGKGAISYADRSNLKNICSR
jgi:hypothetical protein